MFFWAGVGMSLLRWRRRPANRLLLIWLGVMLLPALLSYKRGDGPNSLRIFGAVPVVYPLLGVGMWEIARLLTKRLSTRNEAPAATLVGVLITVFVLLQASFSVRAYFRGRTGTPEYYTAADAELAVAAKVLNAQSFNPDIVNLIPYSMSNGHYGFDYLYQGAA